MYQLLLVSIALLSGVDAADCTATEEQAITDAYSAAAATSACSSYATINTWIFISPPCSATDCVDVMKDLANSIPNCTTGTTSEKDQLLQSLDICATPAPTPASTASSTNCTSAQAQDTFNAFYEAANGTCAGSSTIEAYEIVIDTECNSTCAAAVKTFAQSLPNCNYELSYESTNKKQDIATQFSYCEMLDHATNISVFVGSDYNLLGSAADAAPVVPNCTTQEIEDTVAFFKTVANNESCVYDASVCTYDLHVNADCSSACGDLIGDLKIDLPECYFDHINHKDSVRSSSYQCDWIVDADNITIHFHYSEILNGTGDSSVSCNPNFDSTVTSEDNSLGADSGKGDSSAAKPQNFVLCTIVSAALACVLALHV